MEINGNTLIYGVIGRSINYTLSPKIHNYLFKKFNFNAVYICFNMDFKKDDFYNFLKTLSKSYNIKGLNVTIPYKKFAWEFSKNDYNNVKAVNTLKLENGEILGENTDIYGFKKALVDKLKFNPSGKNFLIYGAGDTARTIIFSILNECNQIYLVNRTLKNAIKLKENFKSDKIILDKPQDYILIDIVINATPVDLTIDYKKFKKECCFFDVKYINSKFITEAKKRKFKAINGKWMLILQGVKSFEFWTGKEIEEKIINNIYRRLR